jgi:hypothetical protein
MAEHHPTCLRKEKIMTITVTVNINDADEKAMLNDLLDIDAWVQAAVVGKINNCKKRMANNATAVLKADASVEAMPATDDGLIDALLARDDYKNRAERDAADNL